MADPIRLVDTAYVVGLADGCRPEIGDILTKMLDQIEFGNTTVFHGVMQQRSHEGRSIELPGGAQCCDGNRVSDVGVTAAAPLIRVGAVCKQIGGADFLSVRCIQIAQLLKQACKGGCRNTGRLLR